MGISTSRDDVAGREVNGPGRWWRSSMKLQYPPLKELLLYSIVAVGAVVLDRQKSQNTVLLVVHTYLGDL